MEATKKLLNIINKNKESITTDGYHQSIMNIMYKYWQQKDVNMNYDEITNWFKNEYGELAQFAVLIGKYNQQVTNGGHIQYYFNRYSGIEEDETRAVLNLHKTLVTLLNKSKLKDEISLQVFKILEEFYIELDEERYIEEEVYNDEGDMNIEEYDNPNYLEIINTDMLNQFDLAYYKINDKFIEVLELYFKTKIENRDTTWDYTDDYYYTQIDDIEINLRVYPNNTISVWIYNHTNDTELLDTEYKNIADLKLAFKNIFKQNINIPNLTDIKTITG
ncbi:MAG: hypothetical protein U9N59_11420, partial [Campylobacterota bacterium]|nr:hypothetical protein [Campylobacterota bacterium]